mmetsp:Transcript_21885/g.51615  ORF Transcript_21885/g.51615 Transcript_21885/m.51615 type:complete len:87 (-) Transcript_21885:170-430(-)
MLAFILDPVPPANTTKPTSSMSGGGGGVSAEEAAAERPVAVAEAWWLLFLLPTTGMNEGVDVVVVGAVKAVTEPKRAALLPVAKVD